MADEYGLIIKNNTDQIIIDSTYRNYSYESHGIASLTKTLDSGETSVSITPTYGNIVAVSKATSSYSRLLGFVSDSTGYTGIRFASEAIQNAPFIYYTEGLKNSIPAYGLLVYDSSASIVFSSGEDGYFNVVGYHTWQVNANVTVPETCATDPPVVPTDTDDITVKDADNNYFHLVGWPYVYVNCGPGSYSWRSMVGFKKINSTTIRIGWFHYDTQTYTGAGTGAGAATTSNRWLIEVEPPPSI